MSMVLFSVCISQARVKELHKCLGGRASPPPSQFCTVVLFHSLALSPTLPVSSSTPFFLLTRNGANKAFQGALERVTAAASVGGGGVRHGACHAQAGPDKERPVWFDQVRGTCVA